MRKAHSGTNGTGVDPSPAGNNGRLGAWYTSYPAGGKDVISVGSVDKFVVDPSSRNLAKHRANSTVTLIQNATIHVNDEEVEPIVSL